MTNSETIKRLLYKEFRESWLIVFTLFVLPAVAISMDRTGRRSEFVDGLVMFTSFLLPVLMVAWAVGKSDVKNGGAKAFSGGLPVNPMLEWFTTTVLPLAVVFPLGMWAAWWFSLTSVSPDQTQVLNGGLLFTAMFTAALVAARLTSIWVGLGAALLTLGFLGAGSNDGDLSTKLCLGVIATALVLSLISVLARKKTPKVRAVWSGAWLVLVAGFVVAVNWQPLGSRPDHSPYSRYFRVNNSFLVQIEEHAQPGGQSKFTAHYGGPPGFPAPGAPVTRVREFPAGSTVVSSRQKALYVLAPPEVMTRRAHLLAWDMADDSVREICSIPTGGYSFGYGSGAYISSDGTQMLLHLPTLLGAGVRGIGSYPELTAIWLVDIDSGKARLCAASSAFDVMSVGWTPKHATLGSSSGVRAVDRRTGRMSKIELPRQEVNKR